MVSHIQLSDFKNSDKIQYLSNFMTFIERNFYNIYGMTTQGADKIAQQTKAEVENGIYCAWIEVLSRLNERIKGFEEVKEKFSLDIPYKLSEVWQKEYDRIFKEETEETEERVSYNDIDDFQDWLKTQIVSFNDTTNEILIAVDGKWESAIKIYKEREESEVEKDESIENS